MFRIFKNEKKKRRRRRRNRRRKNIYATKFFVIKRNMIKKERNVKKKIKSRNTQ